MEARHLTQGCRSGKRRAASIPSSRSPGNDAQAAGCVRGPLGTVAPRTQPPPLPYRAVDRTGADPLLRHSRRPGRRQRAALPLDHAGDRHRLQPGDVPRPADAVLRLAPRAGDRDLLHHRRGRHQRHDHRDGRPGFRILRGAEPGDRRRRPSLRLASFDGGFDPLAHHRLFRRSEPDRARLADRRPRLLEPGLSRLDCRDRGNRTDGAVSLAARAGLQPGGARGDQGESRNRARAAQAARSIQVAVLRQHHPRVQDAAGDDPLPARALAARRGGRDRPHPARDLRDDVPQRDEAAQDDRRPPRPLQAGGVAPAPQGRRAGPLRAPARPLRAGPAARAAQADRPEAARLAHLHGELRPRTDGARLRQPALQRAQVHSRGRARDRVLCSRSGWIRWSRSQAGWRTRSTTR